VEIFLRKNYAIIFVCLVFLLLTFLHAHAEPQLQTNTFSDVKCSYRDRLLEQFKENPISEVLQKGVPLSFFINVDDKNWRRPVHVRAWEDKYYEERWTKAGVKEIIVEQALHQLFEVPIGASEGIEFYVPTGINPNLWLTSAMNIVKRIG
jgi:hypothetical protein